MTPQDSAHHTPVRTAIYGSCVSRDTAEFAGKDIIDVAAYIARQSLLSAGSDAGDRFPDDAQVSSPFQERMMRGDFAGNVIERLRELDGIDLLLWNLTDERHGVYLFDDGAVVTRSIDLINVPEALAAVENARHLPFGTDEHFERWSKQISTFIQTLRELGLLEKTVVLNIPWATTTVDGRPAPASMGTQPAQANKKYRRYVDLLRETGLGILEISAGEVRADPEHVWGLAPFHYSPAVYGEILLRLAEDFGALPKDAVKDAVKAVIAPDETAPDESTTSGESAKESS